MTKIDLFKGADEWILTIGNSQLTLNTKKDFVSLGTDFIVNPSKISLQDGGGLNRVIHKAAGNALNKACEKIKHCDCGDAKVTKAGKLSHAAVIHTVGPSLKEKKSGKPSQQDKKDLASCYLKSCKVAESYCRYLSAPSNKDAPWTSKVHSSKEKPLKTKLQSGGKASITVPCISTGIFKYPVKNAASIQVNTLVKYLTCEKNSPIKEVVISCRPGQKDIPYIQQQMEKIYKRQLG